MSMTEEEQLVDAFFLPAKKERYKEFIRNPKKRNKFLAEMGHFSELNTGVRHEIPKAAQTFEGVVRLLKENGAPDSCLAISDIDEIDGTRLALEDAVGTVLGRTYGTFLSCQPAKLAYFENEDGRWILKR
jgi:hypothetical protein